jgi:lysophospholipase L1-like esterase
MRLRLVAAVVAFMMLGVTTSPLAAAPGEPTAAVSMGDSFIAGEAGRWDGNSSSDFGDRRGTDRAAYRRGWFWRYEQERVYGSSYSNGCHRSDVAPIKSAGLDVEAVFNLACSGASTINLLPAAVGGAAYRGELPQIDQLADVARNHAVEVVAISVSGNDLGFSNVVIDCVVGYVISNRWRPNTCYRSQDRNVRAALDQAMANVGRVLAETRKVLDENGDRSARIVLTSYPSPVAESGNIRYAETGWDRTFRGGCPLWDADLDWANGELVPTISSALEEQARVAGVEFLDLSNALKGHEACASTVSQRPSAEGAQSEWIRFITTGIAQGDPEESAHPNAYGQRALGRCLALALERPSSVNRCTNTPGSGVDRMQLSSVRVGS